MSPSQPCFFVSENDPQCCQPTRSQGQKQNTLVVHTVQCILHCAVILQPKAAGQIKGGVLPDNWTRTWTLLPTDPMYNAQILLVSLDREHNVTSIYTVHKNRGQDMPSRYPPLAGKPLSIVFFTQTVQRYRHIPADIFLVEVLVFQTYCYLLFL